MLTARIGAAGFASAAMAMAKHLLRQTLPQFQAELAAYYQRGLAPAQGPDGKPGVHEVATAEPRRDMDRRLATLLGLDPARVPTVDEIAQVLAGNRADRAPIPGKQVQRETRAMADELGLDASRAPSGEEIGRVLAGCRADDGVELPASRTGVMQGRFLALYGAMEGRALSPEAQAHVRAGRRVDGEVVRLGPLLEGLGATRARVGYIDMCWSADKSVSLAWAMAPTEAERNMIAQAHKDAVDSTMRHVETEIGRARKGKGGMDGFDPGRITWISFDHYASRPTVEVARTDPRTGQAYTELVTLKVAGDPQLHTHVAVPNVVLTEDGRVGALDLQRLNGRVHEFGALYQAYLASNLRRHGAEVVLDVATGAARLKAVPDRVRDAFSKRTRHGTDAARAYAHSAGLDWDTLDDARKVGLAKQGVQGDPRQAKQDDLGDWASWHRQAEALGWQHRSIFDPARAREVAQAPGPDRDIRLEHAYHMALDLFDAKLQRRAVVDGADARVAAARGLVAAGVAGPEDIDAVTRAFARRGVRQDGQDTQLLWGMATDARGQEAARLTTVLQADREAELVRLARTAAADRSGALTGAAIEAAVMQAEARTGVDFAGSEHGRTQRLVMDRLGQGGRLAVAIGVAGAGKSTLLAPLVDAWHAEGRTMHGAALAWRQTDDLAQAGIPEATRAAMSVFLDRAGSGKVALGRDSVVVVDELALLGTRQLLDLLRLQERHGFALVAVGDPLQCRSIEAGPVVDLLRRALGPDAIPEILTTVRQTTERERATSLLFREGQAAEALAIKREDSTARLVAGDYHQAVSGIAALWQERRAANAHDAGYSLSVSAPTNRDARTIGAAIREHRRAAGELGSDRMALQACDQGGDAYDLPLAVGDRVRLFARTNAACADRSRGILGNNGSVLEVRALDNAGVTLRNASGREGLVAWDTLRDPRSGRIRLSYGDVLTIDATQGLTSTEHIEAMPAGTRAVDAHKAYTAASRHRRATFLVVADGAERKEVAGRRPLGDMRPISEADVWTNVARNLSRQPEQDSALSFLERAHAVRRAATVSLQAGLQPLEQRQANGLAPTTLPPRLQRHRTMVRLEAVLEQLAARAREQGAIVEQLARVAPEVQAAVAGAVGELRPALQQAARRLRDRPERVEARRRAAELAYARERLVELRMTAFRGEQPSLTFGISMEDMLIGVKIRREEARQREVIWGLPEVELREALRQETDRQREAKRILQDVERQEALRQEREKQEQIGKQQPTPSQHVAQPPPLEHPPQRARVGILNQAMNALREAENARHVQEVQPITGKNEGLSNMAARIAKGEQELAQRREEAAPKQQKPQSEDERPSPSRSPSPEP
jgi:hypothetical protein